MTLEEKFAYLHNKGYTLEQKFTMRTEYDISNISLSKTNMKKKNPESKYLISDSFETYGYTYNFRDYKTKKKRKKLYYE